MTEPQEFCLRWNNHQATIISVFDYLLENETLVDCTLAAEGQYLKAHKVVLCACSPYLEILLSQHNDKHPILIFKDIKYHELKCMIEYMYKGEVNIAQDQLNHFLKAAESLQIKGLSESEEEPAPQTAVPTPRPPPPRAPPVQRTQPRPFSNAVAVRSTGPSEDDVSKRLIGRTEAQSPTPRKRRRQAPLAVQGRSSISGDDASNASEGHFDQSNCDVPTPSHPTPSDSSKAVAKVESSSELMLEPKTEYDDNDNSVEDITLDDDDEDYSQAGTSQMDNSQGNFGAWQQMVGDQTGDEVFSGQESGVQNSQDLEVTKVRSIKLVCSKSRGKSLTSLVKDDSYCDASTSIESLNNIQDSECSNDAPLSASTSQVANEIEENNAPSKKTIADEETNVEDDPASNDDEEPNDPVCSEDIADETDVEAGNDDNANETDAETNPSIAIQKKSTAIKNIFKSTLAKNKPTLKIKLKKQDIIDPESTAQTRSPRQNAGKNFKKCSLGCKDKKIVAKEEPKSKVLSKLKIFNRPKYKNIIESPKQVFPVPFIKKLKLRNAPPKDTNECTKVKPIKLILKRNTNEEFASSRDPPQSDIESDVENIIQDPPNTSKKSTPKYTENRILKDISRFEKCSDVDSEDKSDTFISTPPPNSPEKLEPFDPHKEFECSDDSDGEEDQPLLLTCAHCDTFGTYEKKDLIRHYKGCNGLCASVICSPVAFKRKKNKCPHCDTYSSSSKTMLRNHLKACKFKPVGVRGRPRKIKAVKEMDTCKFCNFKHPDVNVFLRHLRFCNAAVQQPSSVSSAPTVADPITEKTTVELHKCSSCNYVNNNLNIFLYHLKLCNKNYNNLSLKDMLLKYKDKPNIIGYSKPSTSSEVKNCDSSINIPSSSTEMSNSVINVCTNAPIKITVQKSNYVPSMFDPIDEEDESVDSSNMISKHGELLNKSVDESIDIAESSIPTVSLQQNNYSDPLARFKTLDLSESSESEALSYNKNNSRVLDTNSSEPPLVKEKDDQMILKENNDEFLPNLDVIVSEEREAQANNPSGIDSLLENEHADNFDEKDASEPPPVLENTTGLDSASENICSGTENFVCKDVLPEMYLHESVSTEEVKLTQMPSTSDSNMFETIDHQTTVLEETVIKKDSTLDINKGVVEEYTKKIDEERALQPLEGDIQFECDSQIESSNMKTDSLIMEKSIYNEASPQVPSTTDNILFKTGDCQDISSLEPIIDKQCPLDKKVIEDLLNIPEQHSICIAMSSEHHVVEEQVSPLETSVQNIPITIESTTEKSIEPQYATSTTMLVQSPFNTTSEDMEFDTEADVVPTQVPSNNIEETSKSLQEQNIEEETLGSRRLSFEHFENIASTYYAGQSNSEDENDDDLIRIDPDKEIEHPEINKIDSTTDNIADNFTYTNQTKVVLAQSENCLMDEKTDDTKSRPNENVLQFDSEESNDSKEDVLSLDVSSIHDSLSDTKTAQINLIDPSDTLSQVSSIAKDESFDLGDNNDENSTDDSDDEEHELDSQRTCLNCKSFESDDVNVLISHIKECSNVNSEDDSDDDDSDDSSLENETVVNIPQNSDGRNNEQRENEANAEDTIEGGEKNLSDVTCNKKRKLSLVEAHPVEEEPVHKFLKRKNQADEVTKRDTLDIEMDVDLAQTEGNHSEIPKMDETKEDKTIAESVCGNVAPDTMAQPDVGQQVQSNEETSVADVNNKETNSVNQENEEDSELFCSHCNNFSTYEVDELLNHFNQCTAVMNEHGATPYISSEYNELSGKYDKTNCKQMINAKYTNILLGKRATASPRRGSSSMTPRFTRDLSFSPAESPRYMTELTSLAPSEYAEDNPDDVSSNDTEPNNP